MTDPTHEPTDEQLDRVLATRLTRLADTLTAAGPAVGPDVGPDARLDLARGRRRVRRRRTALGAGTAATVTAVALAAVLLPIGGTPRTGSGLTGQGGSSSPAPSRAVDSAGPAPATERELGFGQTLDVVTPADLISDAAEGYAVVLAERLDPSGEHAVLPTENRQTSLGSSGLTALGTRMGWTLPGQSGRGVVSVLVARRPGSASWECGDPAWSCSDLSAPPGTASARLAEHGDDIEVMVTHADGTVVTVATSPLDGNNSLVSIPEVGLDAAELSAAAADPRLVLPDVAPAPDPFGGGLPSADADPVLRLGQEDLTPPVAGETFTMTDGGLDADGRGYSFLYAGPWTGPGGSGRLTWSPDTDPSVRLNATCTKAWFSRCVVHSEAGRDVFVGYERGGTGWRIYAPGPVRTVSVTFEGTGYPIERALSFVLDPRLQVAKTD